MSQPYLISKSPTLPQGQPIPPLTAWITNKTHRALDPVFALVIGTSSAWLRIRREELERAQVQIAQGQNSVSLPTQRDTWNVLKRRVGAVDVRKWDLRNIWREGKNWGVVD